MQLTLHTDISLRILIFMAGQSTQKRFTIAELAGFFKVPKNHMVKIINKLGKKGYLLNIRGKGGGVYLGKIPEDINIADVIRTMENNTELVDCQKNACPFAGNCQLKCILSQATTVFFDHLSQFTLADILVNQKLLERVT